MFHILHSSLSFPLIIYNYDPPSTKIQKVWNTHDAEPKKA